ADRLNSIAYTAGALTVTNLFDPGGHLTTVKRVDAGGSTVFYQAIGFSDANQLLGVTFGNNASTTYGYYPYSKRLQSIVSKTNAVNFQSLTYAFNAVADLTYITDGVYANGTNSATVSSIGYDNLHRLTSLTRPGPTTTSYAYDRIGNTMSNGEEGGSAYTYNADGLLAHAVKTVGTKQYAYDL